MAFPLESLPDELLCKILTKLQDEPDILLNITPLISERFRILSRDSLVWREFTVPEHWSSQVVAHFFESHPAAAHIRDLRCADYLVHRLTALSDQSLSVPGVRRLSMLSPSSQDYFHVGFSQLQYECLEKIPPLFPDLSYLKISRNIPHTFEQLQKLGNAYPALKLDLYDVSNPKASSVVKLVAVEVNSFEALQEVVENRERSDVSQLKMRVKSWEGLRFKHIAPHITAIGSAVTEMIMLGSASFDDILTIAEACPNLRLLHFHYFIPSELPHEPTKMTNLEELTLCGPPAFLGVVSTRDSMTVINSCPHLQTLRIMLPSDLSAPISFTLPSTLRKFHFLGCQGDLASADYFVFSLLEALKQSCELRSVTIESKIDDIQTPRILSAVTEDIEAWSHLHELEVGGFETPSEVLPLITKLGEAKTPLQKLHLRVRNETVLSKTFLKDVISFPLLCVLYLEIPFLEELIPADLMHLGEQCPMLENLQLCQRSVWTNSERTVQFYIQERTALLDSLEIFKRLKIFHIVNNYFVHMNDTERREAERLLNAQYAPWRRFSVDGHLISFVQCPPTCRPTEYSIQRA